MPLTIVSLTGYLVLRQDEVKFRGGDHDGNKFIKALKGDPINKFATVPVCGAKFKLTENNRDIAFEWFGRMAAARLLQDYPHIADGLVALVPVPSRAAVVNATGSFTPQRMAEQLALCLGRRAEVDDILRWDQPMQSARSGGGTRDPQQLYDHLVLTENPYTDRQCILVDDVCTSGGHLQACAAKLIDHGAKVALAICAGQTVYDQAHEPFGHPDRTVPYFLPATQAVVDYSDADADPFNDYFWDLNLWGSRR